MLLVQLLKSKPWFRRDKSDVFQGSEWVPEDVDEMPKLEAQTWIALYNILSKKICSDKYELHHYRQNVLTGLAGQINANLVCQLPMLEPFKDWLLKLKMHAHSATSTPSKNLVMIETVAQIEESLRNHYEGKFTRLAINISRSLW